jgi:phage gpG-like protein
MNGRGGIIYMHTAGRKLQGFDQLSETMKTEIARNYPEYDRPPEEGDDRDNMTSWKYYKGVREGSIRPPQRDGGR